MPEVTLTPPIEDYEAERLALGAALLEAEAAATVITGLDPEDFHHSLYRTIFRCLKKLHRKGLPLELTLVCRPLKKSPGWPEEADPAVYLASCFEDAIGAFAPHYCERVKKASLRRRLQRDCLEAARLAAEQEDGLEAAAQILRQTLENAEPTSYHLGISSRGGEVGKIMTLAELREKHQTHIEPVKMLPFLGEENLPLFIEGFSHTFSAAPKAGKTTLLFQLIKEWAQAGHRLLYLSEEPESIWRYRVGEEEEIGWLEQVSLICCLGLQQEDLLNRARRGEQDLLILDTSKVLGVEDENDSASVSRIIQPWIVAAREKNQTLIIVHHCRKGGGSQIEAAAGSLAWTANTDRVLVLLADDNRAEQRELRGSGRLLAPAKIAYEMRDERLVSLGSPITVELESIKTRLLEVLPDAWQTTTQIKTALGEPYPSGKLLRRSLEALVREGLAARDPGLEQGSKQGVSYHWRRADPSPTSSPAKPYTFRVEEVAASLLDRALEIFPGSEVVEGGD